MQDMVDRINGRSVTGLLLEKRDGWDCLIIPLWKECFATRPRSCSSTLLTSVAATPLGSLKLNFDDSLKRDDMEGVWGNIGNHKGAKLPLA